MIRMSGVIRLISHLDRKATQYTASNGAHRSSQSGNKTTGFG